MKTHLLIFILLIAATTASAQQPPDLLFDDLLQQYDLSEDSETFTELQEQLQQLYEHPININDSSQLHQLFFLDNLLIHRLLVYQQEYGPLASLQELHFINGFDNTLIALLQPFVVAGPPSRSQPLKLHDILHYGTHDILTGGGRTLETSRAYRNSLYEGDPFRITFRYNFRYRSRVQLQLSGEKDPGEAFFHGSNPQGFDRYNGYLLLNDCGILRRFIAGSYRIRIGQGLTLWTGAKPYTSYTTWPCRSGQVINPGSVYSEYNNLYGAAATFALTPHIDLTAFVSSSRLDSLASPTGYHRTASELRKEQRLHEFLYGANLQYNTSALHLGATIQSSRYTPPVERASLPYNQYDFQGSRNFNAGADATLLIRQLLLFGEFSLSGNRSPAAIAGFQVPLAQDSKFSLYYHNYSKSYQNPHSAALGYNTRNSNEKGISANFLMALPWNFKWYLSADLLQFPAPRYRAYAPSRAAVFKTQLSNKFSQHSTLQFSYRYKDYGRNATSNSDGSYLLEQVSRHYLQTLFEYRTETFRSLSRMAYCTFNVPSEVPQRGLVFSQSLQYTFSRLTFTSSLTLFSINGYDARIYVPESDLPYEYSSAMLYHDGFRVYAVLRYSVSDRLSLGMKYSLTRYFDQTTCGSGNDLIDAPHRQMLKFQVRWKFQSEKR